VGEVATSILNLKDVCSELTLACAAFNSPLADIDDLAHINIQVGKTLDGTCQ